MFCEWVSDSLLFSIYLVKPQREKSENMSDYFSTNALMPDGQLKIIGLEDYLGQFVVILFYQGDFTPFATSELLAFASEHEKFVENDCQVKQNPIQEIPG